MKRYKYGYVSDDWGMNRSLGLIEDSGGTMVRAEDLANFLDKIQPLIEMASYAVSELEFDGDGTDYRGLLKHFMEVQEKFPA